MIVVAERAAAGAVERALRGLGLWTRRYAPQAQHSAPLHGEEDRVSFHVSPSSTHVPRSAVQAVPGVVAIHEAESPHPLVDAMPRVVVVGGVSFGFGLPPVIVAGPCSVESPEQIDRLASAVKAAGAHVLRGGVWKPRTSPRGFQGVGAPALQWLADAGKAHKLPVITEVVSEADVAVAAAVVDALQIGARTMHSGALLRAVGSAGKPVLLKRAFAATLEEWLLAGEALLMAGAAGVLFCERGVRGPDGGTRNTLDVGAVAVLAHVHGLPVLVDPSHAAGRRDVVIPLGRAGLAAGACGVVVETHDQPEAALSDAPQAILPAALKLLL
ncbi:MAG: 3-deoxy-7-phosphoheptulonate synthase [Deltaproteobacteria bacterium]|nr:3-deoxy-7-phosphoheptulonate synthase [Deltaproteobacteria bacterium]